VKHSSGSAPVNTELGLVQGSTLKRVYAGLLLVSALAGCQTEIYSRLDERDANEMLAVLLSSDIEAEKKPLDEKSWRVLVPQEKMAAALDLLRLHGLPQEKYLTLGEVFKKEGLVSTPSEERIRYIYAVSQELSNTLTQIDGVVSARVHVVIPANDPLSPTLKPSSASVFIKHRPDADLQSIAPAVKNLVMRGIEGLTYENISLSIFSAKPIPKVPPRSFLQKIDWVGTLSGFLVVIFLTSLVVFFIRKMQANGTSGISEKLRDWFGRPF
jgi:type III secretion protein J